MVCIHSRIFAGFSQDKCQMIFYKSIWIRNILLYNSYEVISFFQLYEINRGVSSWCNKWIRILKDNFILCEYLIYINTKMRNNLILDPPFIFYICIIVFKQLFILLVQNNIAHNECLQRRHFGNNWGGGGGAHLWGGGGAI